MNTNAALTRSLRRPLGVVVLLHLLLLSLLAGLPAAAVVTGPGGITDGTDTASYVEPGSPAISVDMTPDEFPLEEWHQTFFELGVAYRVEVTFPQQPFGLQFYTPGLAIYESTGAGGTGDLLRPSNGELTRTFDFSPERRGYHFIGVSYQACIQCSFPVAEGDYELRIVIVDDFTGTKDTNGRAGGTAPVRGEINDRGDIDYFAIDLTAGERYEFDLRGASSGGGSFVDPLLILAIDAPSGTPIVASDDNGGTGTDARIVFTPTVSGRYYLIVDQNDLSDLGTYTLETSGGNIPPDTTTWAELRPNDILQGRLNRDEDRDAYRMQLIGGDYYAVEVVGSCPGCTISNVGVEILDTNGEPLLRDDESLGLDGAEGGFVVFRASRSGPHYARVYAADRTASGIYQLALFRAISAALDDDPADDRTQAHAESHLGLERSLDFPGDVDWLRVPQELLEVHVWEVSRVSGDLTPQLALFDAAGNEVAGVEIEQLADRARLRFEQTEFGDHYLAVSDRDGTGIGAYQVLALGGDTPGDTATWAQLEPGHPRIGAVRSSRDADWYAMALEAGVPYEIAVEGAATGRGDLTSARLVLRDGFGEELLRDEEGGEGGNALLAFEVGEPGTYFVEAGGATRRAKGTYEIRFVPEPGAVESGLAAVGALALLAARRRRARQ